MTRKTIVLVALLALLEGGLSTLSLAPYNWPLIVWLVPWPLFYFAERFKNSVPALLAAGSLSAFFLCLFAFSWMLGLFAEFGGIPIWLGVLIFIPYSVVLNLKLPLFVLLFGLVQRARFRRRMPAGWFAAGALALFCDAATPQIFPWFWANLVSKNTTLLQIAEITGIYGLTFVLFAASYWLYRLTRLALRFQGRGLRPDAALKKLFVPRFFGRLLPVPLLVAVVTLFGVWRAHYFSMLQESLPKIRVAALQPNAPLEKYGEDQVTPDVLQKLMHETIPALAREAARAAGGKLDLIVLPESAVPYYSTDDSALSRAWQLYSPEFRLMAQLLAYNFNAEVLLNEVRIGPGGQSGLAYNTAVLFSREGKRIAVYDKRELLAFGEYIPGQQFFEATGLTKIFPTLAGGRYFPGERADTLPFSRGNTAAEDRVYGEIEPLSRAVLGQKTPAEFEREFPADRQFKKDGGFLPMICYEIIIPHFPRAFFREDGEDPAFMVNITQDGWYGNGKESFQHYELGRARAVEYRRAIVRATNSGTSGFVDLAGRYAEPLYGPVFTDQNARAVQVWDVPLYADGPTFYARFGNSWMILPFGFLAGYYVWRRGRESGRRGQGGKGKRDGRRPARVDRKGDNKKKRGPKGRKRKRR